MYFLSYSRQYLRYLGLLPKIKQEQDSKSDHVRYDV